MTQLSIEFAAHCALKAGSVLGNGPHGRIGHKLPRPFIFNPDDIGEIRQVQDTEANQRERNAQQAVRQFNLRNVFNAGRAEVFHGSSSFTSKSPFGFVAPGFHHRVNEALITFRGSSRLLQDYLLIDGAAAFGTSSKGYAVHGGFAKVFNSCAKELDPILNALPPFVRTLHITGHSMGGALATLAAEHLIGRGYHVYLYTFGSPRVGGAPFVRNLESHMPGRIKRYYFWGDVITWVPMFPYIHTTGQQLLTTWSLGGHGNYFKPEKLKLAVPEPAINGRTGALMQANKLIDAANGAGGSGLGSRAISLMWKALNWIFKGLGAALGSVLFTGATIIDQIAAALTHIVTFGYGNSRPLVIKWIIGAFKAICKPITTVRETGSALKVMLTYLLNLMTSGIKSILHRDLADADRSGQQIRFM